jgi:outer membrane protein OmpA-like peptidoglycan-associated protein
MKRIILPFLALGLCISSYAQKDYIRKPALGINLFYYDFQTASDIQNQGLANVLNNKEWSHLSSLKAGISLSYIQGLNSHLDFVGTASGASVVYPIPNAPTSGTESFLLEVAATANLKLLTDKYFVSPFLTIGAGASKYGGYYGAFVPVGVGLQFNVLDEAMILVNSQYRVKLSENVSSHFYYSFGIAGSVFGKKAEAPKPLPLPVVEPVKDRDGDGIVDSLDKCPDIFGLAALQGCPDKDGDGITDAEDKCPDVFGLARYQGCPIPDTDGDGINDETDKCPTVAGVARYQGCPIPDTDGDGINDEVDKCPKVAGPADNYGCPVIGIKAYEIAFKTGSDKLLPHGKLILDTVVAYLNRNTGVNVTVDGYTDNTGSDKINNPLSVKRAEAAKAYLVSKGINADRMTTAGFGSKDPVADNKTADGRKKNRRIEIKIKE